MHLLALNKKQIKKLESTQAKILQSIFGLPRTSSGGALLLVTGLAPMKQRIDYQRTKFYAKIYSHEDSLANATVQFIRSWPLKQQEARSFGPRKLDISISGQLLQEAHEKHPRATFLELLTIRASDNPSIKDIVTTLGLRSIHNNGQELTSKITPSQLISPILSIPQSCRLTISRTQQRRMILWKVGLLPGHPYVTCLFCCLADATRSHIHECLELATKSKQIHRRYPAVFNPPNQPRRYTSIPVHPNPLATLVPQILPPGTSSPKPLSDLDALLDALPRLRHNSTFQVSLAWSDSIQLLEHVCSAAIGWQR
jgi:hypothetical protein